MNAHVGLCIVKMPADSAPVSDQRFSVSALLAILSKMPNPYQLINGYLMKTKKMSSEYMFFLLNCSICFVFMSLFMQWAESKTLWRLQQVCRQLRPSLQLAEQLCW